MFYFERDQGHCIFWPVLAISLRGEFWLGLAWLNMELGWRSGDHGDREFLDNERSGHEQQTA